MAAVLRSRFVAKTRRQSGFKLLHLVCNMSTAKSASNFGSFHSGDVAAMVREDVSKWHKDHVVAVEHAASNPFPSADTLLFGSNAFRAEFAIDFDHVDFVNHGAFGAALTRGSRLADTWRHYQEQQPLRFFDRTLLPELAYATHRIGEFVRCNASDLVLLPNATAGLNAAIAGLISRAEPGTHVMYLSLAYGAVKTMIKEYAGRHGCIPLEIEVPFPLSSSQQLVELVRNAFSGSKRVSLAVFDHITSNTALRLPIEQLASIAQEYGAHVVIDGAHGLLQEDLDVSSLHQHGVMCYVTNGHKWLSTPKGVASMFVAEELHEYIRPVLVSHGYHAGLASAFVWDGCRDYTAALALPHCIDFWEHVGTSRVREYCRGLVKDQAARCARAWKTQLPTPEDMFNNMTLVELPSLQLGIDKIDSETGPNVQEFLYNQGIEVPVKRVDKRLYVRLSAHVYNRPSDYDKLCNLFTDATLPWAEIAHRGIMPPS